MTDSNRAAGADAFRKQLAALEATRRQLAERPEDASASIRRIARTVERQAERAALDDLASAAQRVAGGTDEDIPQHLDALIAALRRTVADAPVPGGTVLVIEDDRPAARLLEHALRREGWQVAIAATAAEAEAILREQPLSAIVLDLVLPDADGRNLLLRLKEDPSSTAVPVYVASARSDPYVRAECLALGAEDFLAKPVDAQRLLDLIAHRAARAAPGRMGRAAVPSLVDRGALVRTYRSAPGSTRTVALAAVQAEGMSEEEALRSVAQAITAEVSGAITIARWQPSQLCVLFGDCEATHACSSLAAARRAVTRAGSGLDLSAGVTAVESGEELEEAVGRAGRRLYLAQTSGTVPVVCDPDEIAPRPVRILLAEDDEVAAKLVIYRLTREPGFEVTHRTDGLEALDAAKRHRFDLAILDVNMPGIDGFDLLARLRAMPEYSRVPIVMLTALGSEKDVVRGLELGADDYIVKPFSPVELLARVRRLLAAALRVA